MGNKEKVKVEGKKIEERDEEDGSYGEEMRNKKKVEVKGEKIEERDEE